MTKITKEQEIESYNEYVKTRYLFTLGMGIILLSSILILEIVSLFFLNESFTLFQIIVVLIISGLLFVLSYIQYIKTRHLK